MIHEFLRRFRAAWPKGAILWDVTSLVVLALSIALQVAAQLLRGPIKREGPRLDDLSPTGVQPGAIIPATHGHTTAPGTVIAQTRLKETVKKDKVGGKGGPSVETTNYSYSIPAVAVAFSRRRIDAIVRIKANEKVIYEQTATEGLVYRNFAEIEVFLGTETQAPSAILEAHEGVGKIPAYRGTAYFVLKDLQLGDFGNRMPVFKVECAETATVGDVAFTEGAEATSTANGQIAFVDWSRQRAFATEDDELGVSHFLLEFDLDGSFIEEHYLTIATTGHFDPVTIDQETGYLAGWSMAGDFYHQVYDPVAKSMVTEITEPTSTERIITGDMPGVVLRHSNGTASLLTAYHTDEARVHSFTGMVFQHAIAYPGAGQWRSQIVAGEEGEAFAFWRDGTSQIRVVRYLIGSAGTVTESEIGTIQATAIGDSQAFSTFVSLKNVHYDPARRGLHFAVEKADAVTRYAVGFSLDAAAIIYASLLPDVFDLQSWVAWNTRLNGGIWAYQSGDGLEAVAIDLVNGQVSEISLPSAPLSVLRNSFWDDVSGCLYAVDFGTVGTQIDKWCLSFDVGKTSIGLILRAALTEWAPDVSPLAEGDHFEIDAALFAAPFLVTGATFTQLAAPREIAEMCAVWKPVVFFEGGDRIKFRARDGSRQATVRHLDMGQRGLDEEVRPTVTTSRQDDVQLPREVRTKFLDENRMFSANAAYARITRSRSTLVQEFELPFAGTPAEAKFAAWTAMGEAYAARRSHEGTLPLPYFILEPGDIIDLPNNEGDLLECRVGQLELGANLIIALKAADHVNSYDNVAFAAETGVLDKLPLVRPELPIMYALDLPRLTYDPDVDDGLKMLIGLGGTYSEWKGGAIYRDIASGSGATAFGESVGEVTQEFEEIATTILSVDGGDLTTPPSGAVDEFTVDRISVMRVTFDTADPVFSSLSDAAFLAGFSNVFAIGSNVTGWEIVQAQEANQVSAQVWDFSVLRRGIRGTEHMIGETSAGDTVVALSSATLQRDGFVTSDIGGTITYRGVTTGMDVASAPDTDVVVVGRGLIPYAPLLGQVYRDASGTITGTLYARPLQADDADQFFLVDPDFEIDVKDGPGGTVLRTITMTDTGAFTYTAAQQTTDFGGPQAAVDAEIFQLDNDGNRGYGREVIL